MHSIYNHVPLQYSFCSIALFSSINIVVRHNTIRGGEQAMFWKTYWKSYIKAGGFFGSLDVWQLQIDIAPLDRKAHTNAFQIF